jgi:hypothetical protein
VISTRDSALGRVRLAEYRRYTVVAAPQPNWRVGQSQCEGIPPPEAGKSVKAWEQIGVYPSYAPEASKMGRLIFNPGLMLPR